MRKFFMVFAMFLFTVNGLKAQGILTGYMEIYQNFFFLDSNILSQPIPPQYYKQLSSTDA